MAFGISQRSPDVLETTEGLTIISMRKEPIKLIGVILSRYTTVPMTLNSPTRFARVISEPNATGKGLVLSPLRSSNR